MATGGGSEAGTTLAATPRRWVQVGRVLRPAGRAGELLVELYGDDLSNLLDAPLLRLEGAPGEIPFRLRAAQAAGSHAGAARARVRLAGLESPERASHWRGARVALPEDALRPLPDGEFYWRDIIGLRARLPDGREIGCVEEIWPTGASDVLVVRDGRGEVLVPAVPELLVRVDLAAGEIWLDPPVGLIEGEA